MEEEIIDPIQNEINMINSMIYSLNGEISSITLVYADKRVSIPIYTNTDMIAIKASIETMLNTEINRLQSV